MPEREQENNFPDKEVAEAIQEAEEILYGPHEVQQNRAYPVKLPTETVYMFYDRLSEYLDTYSFRFHYSHATDPMYAEERIRYENQYNVLHEKLSDILTKSKQPLITLSVSGHEVDVLSDLILFDAWGQDESGYRWHVSDKELAVHAQRARVFIDFLYGFHDAGGDMKYDHRDTYAYFFIHTAQKMHDVEPFSRDIFSARGMEHDLT